MIDVKPGQVVVAIEGIDGSGKSTVARSLHDQMRGCRLVIEPGGTALGKEVRTILTDYPGASPITKTLLYAAARSHLLDEVAANIKDGTSIVFDRSFISSLAYQGSYSSEDLMTSTVVNSAVIRGSGVALTHVVWLDADLDVLLARARARGGDDPGGYESDRERMRLVQEMYKWLFDRNATQITGVQLRRALVRRFDATLPHDVLVQQVIDWLTA